MMKNANLSRAALSAALLALLFAFPAKADFFDGARQVVQKDIPHFFQNDVPHFFQDDIPCAFGGAPTSHTKKSCHDRGNSASHSPDNSGAAPATTGDSKQDSGQAQAHSKY